MKELPMFTYNLWMGNMGCLQPDTKSIILSSYQHCDKHATISNTLVCILHNYSSVKARFSHTSTVIRLHSCSGTNYAYALHASCFYIEINIFEHF